LPVRDRLLRRSVAGHRRDLGALRDSVGFAGEVLGQRVLEGGLGELGL